MNIEVPTREEYDQKAGPYMLLKHSARHDEDKHGRRMAWLKELRSGKWTQITRHLTYFKGGECVGACCLGVASEILHEELGIARNLNGCVGLYRGEHRSESLLLLKEFREALGLILDSPVVLVKTEGKLVAEEVATLNDKKVPFAVIADLLEGQMNYERSLA